MVSRPSEICKQVSFLTLKSYLINNKGAFDCPKFLWNHPFSSLLHLTLPVHESPIFPGPLQCHPTDLSKYACPLYSILYIAVETSFPVNLTLSLLCLKPSMAHYCP